MSTDELLTSSQAGYILGKSVRTVARMADRGELPVAQRLPGVNGSRLFRRDVVEQLAVAQDAKASA